MQHETLRTATFDVSDSNATFGPGHIKDLPRRVEAAPYERLVRIAVSEAAMRPCAGANRGDGGPVFSAQAILEHPHRELLRLALEEISSGIHIFGRT